MKKNLGKIIIILSLIHTGLHATQLATYKLYADIKEAYVKEAIKITFVAHQKEHSKVMYFFLNAKKSDDYKIKLLTKTIEDHSYHDTTATFTYILFPLKAKVIKVDFFFTIKTTTDKGVAHAYVEDHDDSKGIDLEVSKVKVKSLKLTIKPIIYNVALVGDFTLTSTIDKKDINQYENTNLYYTINGIGYAEDNINFIHNIKNVTLFSDTNNLIHKLTKNGYLLKKEYLYAISAKNDFNISEVNIRAFSPKTEHFYFLKTPKYKIKVTKINSAFLLDKEESPKHTKFINIQILKNYSIYLFIFVSGYILAKIMPSNIFQIRKNKKFQDIKNSSTAKELIFVLLKNYSNKNINQYISKLEIIIYANGDNHFKEIKNDILNFLHSS